MPDLLSIKTKADLEVFLDIPSRKLHYLLYVLHDDQRYKTFKIKKRTGGDRTICAPSKPLKEIQSRLAKALTEEYVPKGCVYSYVLKKGILENAMVHQGKRWIMRIDLKDFFPSIHFGRVRGVFLAKPFQLPQQIATMLAHICTTDNSLPQGAPTSPVISNLICRKLDSELWALASQNRCLYTRYADDLTFYTSRRSFPADIGYLHEEEDKVTTHVGAVATQIIVSNDFTINDSKVALRQPSMRQIVTGIVVNEKVNVKREYIRSVKAMLYSWEHYGQEAAGKYFFSNVDAKNRPPAKDLPKFSQIVTGKVQYVGYVKGWDDPVYLKLAKKLSELHSAFVFDKKKAMAENEKVLLKASSIVLDVSLISLALIISFAGFLLSKQAGEDTWFSRSGSFIVAIAIVVEFRGLALQQQLSQIATEESQYHDVTPEKWRIPVKRIILNWIVLIVLVVGTLIWGFGDRLF